MNQVALDQLIGETAGDLLHLMLVPGARINAKPALGPAERRFHQGTFIGHQRGKCLDLVLIDAQRIADAALDRLHMFGMHRAIAGKGLDLAAQAHAKAHRIGRVADTDFFLQPRPQIHQRGRPPEHQIDGFAKTRFAG